MKLDKEDIATAREIAQTLTVSKVEQLETVGRLVTVLLDEREQQRTWVGLTEEEIRSVEFDHIRRRDFAKAIESMLREKNGMTQQEGSEG